MTTITAPTGELRRALKRCSSCGREQPLSNFHVKKTRQYRYPNGRCKPCEREHDLNRRSDPDERLRRVERERARRAAQTEEDRARRRERYAARADQINELRRLRRERQGERIREVEKAWRHRNPEKVRAWNQEMRAIRAGAPVVESVDPAYVFARDGGRCHICNRRVVGTKFHLDHLVPIARGGEHSNANVRIAHAKCNQKRGPGRIPAQLLLVG